MTHPHSRFAVYILEKRHADGSLDLSDPQPPFLEANLETIFNHYFRYHPNAPSCTQEECAAWYRSQGFVYRQKTW